jgi:dynactin 1
LYRIQAQFEHLAETYFSGYDHDLGERELSFALSFDNDLDMVLASTGLTKTAIESVLKDDGEKSFGTCLICETNCFVIIDVNVELDSDPVTDIFEPLQRVLDHTKAAKVLSR